MAICFLLCNIQPHQMLSTWFGPHRKLTSNCRLTLKTLNHSQLCHCTTVCGNANAGANLPPFSHKRNSPVILKGVSPAFPKIRRGFCPAEHPSNIQHHSQLTQAFVTSPSSFPSRFRQALALSQYLPLACLTSSDLGAGL